MASTTRSEAQRAASRCNGAHGTGPRSADGRVRSSMNRTVHGLNSVRLLLATEDVEEYRQHVHEWTTSLAPATPAEHQIAMLIGDLAWRLKRVSRIEERRALTLLDDLVERTPEWQMRKQAHELATALDTVSRIVSTSAVPVPSGALGGFLAGVSGVVQMLDAVRELLPVDMWPEIEVCAFLAARSALAKDANSEERVTETFNAIGATACTLATALRALARLLDAAIEKTRTAISTTTLLVDDEDRRFERHRRILETGIRPPGLPPGSRSFLGRLLAGGVPAGRRQLRQVGGTSRDK